MNAIFIVLFLIIILVTILLLIYYIYKQTPNSTAIALKLIANPITNPTTNSITNSVSSVTIKSTVPSTVIKNLTEIANSVFIEMLKDFPQSVYKNASITIDDNVDTPVAYTTKNNITVNGKYLSQHPLDLDLITHELFHVIQSGKNAPSWFTEGAADWARNKYGKQNAQANWSLQSPSKTSKYTDGYRITGNFFKYLDTLKPGFLTTFYNTKQEMGDQWWISTFGANVDSLWNTYVDKNISNRVEVDGEGITFLKPH